MNKDTLFNEDDEHQKEEQKEKDNELDLEDEEEDILPIEETGGGGRKILWTIVVLIIIGLGIYSFAKREQIREGLKGPENQTQNIGESAQDKVEEFNWQGTEEGKEPTVEEKGEQITLKESELPKLEEVSQADNQQIAQNTEEGKSVDTNTANPEQIPEITVQDDKLIVTAAKGEGITHLARRALALYLEKSGKQNEISASQKIYIEDYLQNRTGQGKLQIGEQKTFTTETIEQAIDSAKKLDEKQLQNLEKYAKVVYGSSGS